MQETPLVTEEQRKAFIEKSKEELRHRLRGRRTDNRRMITLRPVVNKLKTWCGHKIHLTLPPKTNCTQCWNFYFLGNVKQTQAVVAALVEGHREVVRAQYGRKFTKQAERFLSDVRNVQQVGEEAIQSDNFSLVVNTPVAPEDQQYEVVDNNAAQEAINA